MPACAGADLRNKETAWRQGGRGSGDQASASCRRFERCHSLRRTKAVLIYRRTGNLRAVRSCSGTRRSRAPFATLASKSMMRSRSRRRSTTDNGFTSSSEPGRRVRRGADHLLQMAAIGTDRPSAHAGGAARVRREPTSVTMIEDPRPLRSRLPAAGRSKRSSIPLTFICSGGRDLQCSILEVLSSDPIRQSEKAQGNRANTLNRTSLFAISGANFVPEFGATRLDRPQRSKTH